MAGTTKKLMYDIVKPWYWAPEAWKALGIAFVWGVVAGAIAMAWFGINPVKATPHPTVTVTVPGPTYYTSKPKP